MEDCTCDITYSVCGSNCPSTQLRCQCKNKAGDMVVGDSFDIGQLLPHDCSEVGGHSRLTLIKVTTSALLGQWST